MNDFNRDMAIAKDVAMDLPGGELLVEEQDEIIDMLEILKQRRKCVLSPTIRLSNPICLPRNILDKFCEDISHKAVPDEENVAKVEVDSTASTPAP